MAFGEPGDSALRLVYKRPARRGDGAAESSLLKLGRCHSNCGWARIGIPIPALSAALNYYDSYRSERLPQNLLQAQRDYFGAHTYERVDRDGAFHTDWLNLRREPE